MVNIANQLGYEIITYNETNGRGGDVVASIKDITVRMEWESHRYIPTSTCRTISDNFNNNEITHAIVCVGQIEGNKASDRFIDNGLIEHLEDGTLEVISNSNYEVILTALLTIYKFSALKEQENMEEMTAEIEVQA